MPTVEDIIVARYGMTLEDFIERGVQIVPAYYSKIINAIRDIFDLRPAGIRKMLNLARPIYQKTASFGHFGRDPDKEGCFTWEKTDKVEELKKLL